MIISLNILAKFVLSMYHLTGKTKLNETENKWIFEATVSNCGIFRSGAKNRNFAMNSRRIKNHTGNIT